MLTSEMEALSSPVAGVHCNPPKQQKQQQQQQQWPKEENPAATMHMCKLTEMAPTMRQQSLSTKGVDLIPRYGVVFAWNLIASCSTLIDDAGKNAPDVGDLVQGLGQGARAEASILLLLPAPLKGAKQVVAGCWSIPLQATVTLPPSHMPERM